MADSFSYGSFIQLWLINAAQHWATALQHTTAASCLLFGSTPNTPPVLSMYG